MINACQSLLDNSLLQNDIAKKPYRPSYISFTIFYYFILSSLFYLVVKAFSNKMLIEPVSFQTFEPFLLFSSCFSAFESP